MDDNKKLLLILAALGIGVAGYYLYKKSQATAAANKLTAANAAAIAARIPSVTPLPIILPTTASTTPPWFLLPETPATQPVYSPSLVDSPQVVYNNDLHYSINPNEYIS